MMNEHPLLETLRSVAADLLYPSETDAPLEAFYWADTAAAEEGMVAAVARQLGVGPEALTSRPVGAFFHPVVQQFIWQNEAEKAEVQRWQELVRLLKHSLQAPTVLLAGDAEKTACIVGLAGSGYAGWKTTVVET